MRLNNLNKDIVFKDAIGKSLDKSGLKWMTFDVDEIKPTKERRVWVFTDWTGRQNDY